MGKPKPEQRMYVAVSHDQPGRPIVRMEIAVEQVQKASDGDKQQRRNLCLRYMAATGIMIPYTWGEDGNGLSITIDKDQTKPYDSDALPLGRPKKIKEDDFAPA